MVLLVFIQVLGFRKCLFRPFCFRPGLCVCFEGTAWCLKRGSWSVVRAQMDQLRYLMLLEIRFLPLTAPVTAVLTARQAETPGPLC